MIMTNEEARERLEDWSPWQDIGDYDRFREALDMAIKALEQQPCDDCISREEALKIMCDNCPMYNCVCGCSSYRHIEKMSSVIPQRPKGKWTQKTGSRALCCSVCEDCIPEEIPCAFDYCPNCGADMRGEQNDK